MDDDPNPCTSLRRMSPTKYFMYTNGQLLSQALGYLGNDLLDLQVARSSSHCIPH